MVAVHEGRPFVTTTGVELWHRACWDRRDEPVVDEVAARSAQPVPIARSRRRSIVAATATAATLGLALAGWAWAFGPAAASLANVELSVYEPVSIRERLTANEIAPPWVCAQADRYAVPTMDGEPLDRTFPALRGWIHPVTASPELVPTQSSRLFGSERRGIERTECGQGHCGIDLDGPRGRPVVAVAAGNVVRVEHSELGLDGRSGRFVRIGHDDGTLTAYMHLDDIADGLSIGDRVDAGQVIGTLGATAVFQSVPHLHFTLEVSRRPGMRGDHVETQYVDPAPFLARARITPVPDRPRVVVGLP